jgi:hypothetical protein
MTFIIQIFLFLANMLKVNDIIAIYKRVQNAILYLHSFAKYISKF